MKQWIRGLLPVLLLGVGAGAWAARLLAADEAARLTIVDEQGESHVLSSDELAKLPQKSAKVSDQEGKEIEYEGVELAEILKHCGVVLGKDLRGPRVASYVLIEAEDGYRVVLAIGEVDPATTDKVVLLALRRDGAELPEKEWPFRLVIPGEKRPVRWIRMIKRISVRRAAD